MCACRFADSRCGASGAWGWAWLPAVALVAATLALGAASPAKADESLEQRRQRVEQLPPAEKEALRRRQERFAGLDAAQQAQLRQLNAELQRDPHADQLKTVAEHYQQWVMTLPPTRRDELLQLEPAERIKRVKALLEEQRQERAKWLQPADAAGLARWMEQMAERQESGVMSQLKESRQKELQQMPPAVRAQHVFGHLWAAWQFGGQGRIAPPSEQDLAELRGLLSEPTRKALEQRPYPEQVQLVHSWIRQLFYQRLSSGKGLMPSISEDQLVEFFEKELTDRQREYLLGLPADEMQRRLREMYFASSKDAVIGGPPRGARKGMGGEGPFPHKPKRRDPGLPPDEPPPPEN